MGFKGITVNTAASADAHIFAEDDAAIYQAIFGGDGVMNIGNKFAARVLSNNKVRVSDGVLCVGGHIGRMQYADYTDLTIENGVSGKNRNDIIYAKFVTSGDVDSYVLDVRKGTAGSTAADPAMTQGNLYQGATLREYPLWRVKIEGLSIVKIEQLFSVIPTIPELQEEMKSGLSEVNRNLVKYNEETDSLDVFFNGEIAGSFPCGFQALDLYNYGDECVDVTGGWTIFNSHVNATFTKTANGMYLKTTGDGVYLNIKTANTIDFSKYSKLCIETSDCKLVRSQPWMLYVKCGGSTYDIVERVSEYRTETIDLPDTMKFAITGNNETNVTITVNNGGAYADSVTEITIHRIYLIK